MCLRCPWSARKPSEGHFSVCTPPAERLMTAGDAVSASRSCPMSLASVTSPLRRSPDRPHPFAWVPCSAPPRQRTRRDPHRVSEPAAAHVAAEDAEPSSGFSMSLFRCSDVLRRAMGPAGDTINQTAVDDRTRYTNAAGLSDGRPQQGPYILCSCTGSTIASGSVAGGRRRRNPSPRTGGGSYDHPTPSCSSS